MPHSTVMVPPDRALPVARVVAAGNALLGLLWTGWLFTSWRPLDPMTLAGLTIALVAVAWSATALRTAGLTSVLRVNVVLAGASAIAVWIPVPYVAAVALPLAAHLFVLFPVFLSVIALVLWGAACTTWYLSREAAASLFWVGPPESVAV